MTPIDLAMNTLGLAGLLVGGWVVVRASRDTRAVEVWRQEAEAQKARADRLQDDLTEIKDRLTRIEAENRRLVELLTALDPAQLSRLRP
jgi:predicted nuclease with TOPRIM domain